MMENLLIINILLNRVADIYIKLKSVTSKLHNALASVAFIKKVLFADVIPKLGIVKGIIRIVFLFNSKLNDCAE